ncbi:hypothetical protein PFISCL1PPCAC_28064, partial [Pristionchus fissidentatus]
ADSYMTHKGLKQQKVVCDIISEELVINMDGGDAVNPADPISCVKCTCDPASMDEKKGVCPLGSLCIKPTSVDKCKSTCPEGTEAVYKDKDGMAAMSATIECQASGDWIADGSDDTVGVACFVHDLSKVVTMFPPEVLNKCPELNEYNCPAECQNLPLYVKTGDSYKVLCSFGALTTDKIFPATQPDLTCGTNGMWENSVTEVNCVVDEVTLFGDCYNTVTDAATKANLGGFCGFGSCSVECTNGKMLMYTDVDGKPGTVPSLECMEGVILGPFRKL